jgi:hypothetical protein
MLKYIIFYIYSLFSFFEKWTQHTGYLAIFCFHPTVSVAIALFDGCRESSSCVNAFTLYENNIIYFTCLGWIFLCLLNFFFTMVNTSAMRKYYPNIVRTQRTVLFRVQLGLILCSYLDC